MLCHRNGCIGSTGVIHLFGVAIVHEAGSIAGIQANHLQKLRMMLTALDTAVYIVDYEDYH